MFCEYSNIFGKPNEGIHSIRFGGLAIIDIIFTIGVAYLINNWTGRKKFILILIILFISGIIFHRLFCVRTSIDKLLFE
jgi:hypothetical protein